MKPLTLLIKPASGLCNMNCSYCFYRPVSEERENSVMTDETADILIQRIREYQPSVLSVAFQGGEPTLAGLGFYERFTERLREAVSCPVSFSIQTNGLLIDGKFAEFFKKNGYLVGLSLDGNAETNDRFRRDKDGSSVFSRVMKAVSVLREYGVDFNILAVTDDRNAADIGKTYAFFKQQGFGFIQFIPCLDEGSGISLSNGSYEAFLKKSFDLWYDDYVSGRYISVRHIDNYISILLSYPPENCAMCGVCSGYFVVDADGSLYPCDFYCNEKYKIGTIRDIKPFEMSVKQRTFIEESYKIHPFCESCEYHFLCRGGCKRDRTDGFTKNRYCEAYRAFFDYALERMTEIAGSLEND